MQQDNFGPRPPFEALDLRHELRALCKDQNFSPESEVRITHTKPALDLVKFLPHAMGPRPHLPLGVPDGDGGSWSKLPIREIKLGPGAPKSATLSTRWLLQAKGYSVLPEADVAEDSEGRHHHLGWDHSQKVTVTESELSFRQT